MARCGDVRGGEGALRWDACWGKGEAKCTIQGVHKVRTNFPLLTRFGLVLTKQRRSCASVLRRRLLLMSRGDSGNDTDENNAC